MFKPSSLPPQHHLFIPAADPLETMWSVAPPSLQEAKDTLDSDETKYTSTLSGQLDHIGQVYLHTLPITIEYPPLPPSVLKLTFGGEHSTDYLLTALHIARLTKDEAEIALIREANRISSGAHEVLMNELGRYAESRAVGSGKNSEKGRTGKEGLVEWEVESEGDAEALFVATCRREG